ncbi:hypothetical protein C8R43DRAFT_955744 [Mycena crocata]|nr:hypothetical protein C8R43DRAFT_955744 [Mycena crocata]
MPERRRSRATPTRARRPVRVVKFMWNRDEPSFAEQDPLNAGSQEYTPPALAIPREWQPGSTHPRSSSRASGSMRSSASLLQGGAEFPARRHCAEQDWEKVKAGGQALHPHLRLAIPREWQPGSTPPALVVPREWIHAQQRIVRSVPSRISKIEFRNAARSCKATLRRAGLGESQAHGTATITSFQNTGRAARLSLLLCFVLLGAQRLAEYFPNRTRFKHILQTSAEILLSCTFFFRAGMQKPA